MATNPTYEQSKEIAEASRESDWTKPSFGKNLFLGSFQPELIHPQPESPPEIVAKGEPYLERLKAFLVAEVDPLQIEADAKIPEHVIEGLKGLGALGMKIPEEYGGLGLTQVYYNKALALVGTWHSSLATLLSAHQSIGLPEPLRMFGTEEQKREWLPKVSNTHISAFLLTEPTWARIPPA
jgi:alkylation response protein AidB-like acyl-CoA dehydrogenase